MRRSPRHRISYALRDTTGPLQPHSAGINSLALDTTTPTPNPPSTDNHYDDEHHVNNHSSENNDSPGGILYTAGRDSVVNAWNCHIDFARHQSIAEAREQERQAGFDGGYFGSPDVGTMNGMLASPVSATLPRSTTTTTSVAGAALGVAGRSFSGSMMLHGAASGGYRRSDSYPGVDRPARLGKGSAAKLCIPKVPPTLIRSFQHHSGWVNDIVLIDNNRHILTASNDRTIFLSRADQTNAPTAIGVHADYVKCLAYAKHANYVASAGLDHHVFLWDLEYGGANGPPVSEMTSMSFAHDLIDEGRTSSVYALACNPSGSILVSGSTDKSVRVWDYRTKACVMRLQGHQDNIRSLLVSDDGQRILSASCDQTVKLWSLAKPHRPVHTYSHFEDSVYCLYSTHPDLDTFWTGGRDGWVTKVSSSKTVDTSDDLMEVVAICKEDSPVQKIVAINDMYIWTATTSSTVNRWRDIPFQHVDFADPTRPHDAAYNSNYEDHGRVLIPKNSMLTIPNVSSLIDQASIMTQSYFRPFSVCGRSYLGAGGGVGANRGVKDTSVMVLAGGDGDEGLLTDEEPVIEPAWKEPNEKHAGVQGIRKSAILNNRRHLVTEDEAGQVALWDIIGCTKLATTSQQSFEEFVQQHQTLDWISNWCTIDTHKGFVVVHLEETNCFDAEMHLDQTGVPVKVPSERLAKGEEPRVSLGKWVLTLLLKKYTDALHAPFKGSSKRYSRRGAGDDDEEEAENESEGEPYRTRHAPAASRSSGGGSSGGFFSAGVGSIVSGLRAAIGTNTANSGANAAPPTAAIASPGIQESPRVSGEGHLESGDEDCECDDAEEARIEVPGAVTMNDVESTPEQEELATAEDAVGASWTVLGDGTSESDRASLNPEVRIEDTDQPAAIPFRSAEEGGSNDILFSIPPPPATAPPPEAFSAASSYSSLYVSGDGGDDAEDEDGNQARCAWPEGETDSLQTYQTAASASTNAESAGLNGTAIVNAAVGYGQNLSTTTPPASGRSSPSIVHTPPSFMEKIRSQVRRRASSTKSEELINGGPGGAGSNSEWSSLSSLSGGESRRSRHVKSKLKDKKERPSRPARTDSKGRLLTFLKGSSPSPSPEQSARGETASQSSSAEQPGSTEPSPGDSPSNPFQTGYPVEGRGPTDEQQQETPSPTPGPSPLSPAAAETTATSVLANLPRASTPPRPPPRTSSRSSSRSSTSSLSSTTSTSTNSSTVSSTPSYIDPIATPMLHIPAGVPFVISKEEGPEDAAFLDVYKGVVGGLGLPHDVAMLDRHLPSWVVGPIVEHKPIAPRANTKLEFFLKPWPGSGVVESETTAWNLQAPRLVRMRKLLAYVAGKVPEAAPPGMAGDPLAASAQMEMVFNNEPVDPLLTLAGLKQHFWDGRGGFILYYRQKTPSAESSTLA
ncbi:hypothetical protein BDZ88DRAFT_449765 [Geranomyces variabilis]|nr:hypothetical protein BDZ88DRAFT_449765 [Geranomyces variabilis]KAJ3137389.1 hypothetical protein HDU90_002176 [Geranomyces variabilis]